MRTNGHRTRWIQRPCSGHTHGTNGTSQDSTEIEIIPLKRPNKQWYEIQISWNIRPITLKQAALLSGLWQIPPKWKVRTNSCFTEIVVFLSFAPLSPRQENVLSFSACIIFLKLWRNVTHPDQCPTNNVRNSCSTLAFPSCFVALFSCIDCFLSWPNSVSRNWSQTDHCCSCCVVPDGRLHWPGR